MATLVLVHGGWHGGWCWAKVLPRLRQAGHDVFTPTLTGLGERSHLLAPSIDLTCHIQDIVNVLIYEDLNHVILVGHSYGGMVIRGVADQCANRIAHMVNLDAFVPQNGQSCLDQLAATSDVREATETMTATDEWFLAPGSPDDFGVTDPDDVRWMEERLSAQSIKTTTEPLWLHNPEADLLPRTFISCTVDQEAKMPSGALTAARIRKEAGWHYHELETGHDAMITAPDKLVNLLLQLVS